MSNTLITVVQVEEKGHSLSGIVKSFLCVDVNNCDKITPEEIYDKASVENAVYDYEDNENITEYLFIQFGDNPRSYSLLELESTMHQFQNQC